MNFMKPTLLLFATALLVSIHIYSQTGVSINTTGTEPDGSAMLDVSSTEKGILIPRMSEPQRIAIASPAIGLLVYQNDGTEGFYYFDGTAWTILTGGSQWATNGSNIYYNVGNVGIGTASPTATLNVHSTGIGEGNVLFTGEYKISNQGNPPAEGPGTRFMWYPDKAALRAGYVTEVQWDKNNIGILSVALGHNTIASSIGSTALGSYTKATNFHATALGRYTVASGQYSTAMGLSTEATGNYGTSMGSYTKAVGFASTAMGRYTTAQAYGSIVMGRYNIIAGNGSTWEATDPLFVIGNGSADQNRSNAFAVLKNANTTIGGSLTINGNGVNTSYLFPATRGTSGQVLKTAGDGTTSWGNAVEPGTNAGQMQYWNGTAWVTVEAGTYGQILEFRNGGPEWVDKNINTLNVGDTYQGGIIAYFLQSGDPGYDANIRHGIIATPADISTGAGWGCMGSNVGDANIVLGAGAQNTLSIVTGCSEPGIAARICYDLILNGYSDWFLPSGNELLKLYQNKSVIGGFENTIYWSSTKISANNAVAIDFTNGSAPIDIEKSSLRHVRAIRAF